MKNESRISVRTLTAMALLIAMSIVFSRVLSISTGFVRFNLGSLPVLLAGILFGPWAGFVVGMVADIIGGVLAGYAINPLITLGAASIGLVGGLGWQKLSHLRTGNRLWCSVLAAHFVGSMVINSLALHIFYGYAWAVLIARIPNALVLNMEPQTLAERFPGFFDRIVVDAPCSGEGMFRKEPVALQQHCEALVKQCAELGAQILDCAAAALAPGGQLVYSTCTFAPEEDEGQVAAFLQRHPEFALADVLGNVDYTFGSAGEENRTGGLPLDVSKVRRVWPCQGGEGHFMARLVKAGTPRTLSPEGEYTPEEQLWLAAAAEAGKKGKGKAKPAKIADARSTRRADSRACRDAVQGTSRRTRDTGAGEATPAQSLAAWQEFARQYFPALAQRPAVVHGGGVLLPVAFPQTGLHVLRAGVFVGSVQKGRFVPEHHLFTAFGGLCTNCEQLTLADCRCTEYLSGREVEARTAADGWCCVTVDGWPLGGGKVSGGRVKNHYPKALRLL